MERFSISVTLGKVSSPHGANLEHNNRNFIAQNVRRDQIPHNILFKQQDVQEAYAELFGAAIDDYNAKQKQPCRRIKDYYSHIASGKREEPFYEVIVQLGDCKDQLGEQPLLNAEMQMEDDYNMLDGIINNGSKEDIDKAKAELSEGIKNMESLADNPFVSDEVRASAAEELTKLKNQLELLNMHDEVEVDSWLSDMLDKGDAVLTDDGGFKVNPDYYKELPRNDRHVETMTEIQAVEVMSSLTAAGIDYSAATKGEDKVGITVSKKDVPALNDVMYAAIGKIARTEAAQENGGKGEKGKYQTINPEYYASLGKEDKHTRVEPIDTARKIVAELQKSNIPYSAVVRKNDTVAVTVSKANAQAYKQIESAVKGERAVEYVNPDFFKALPKQERFTQRMDEGQARKKSAELTARGVEHSAVFGGEKSAVTVSKKDSQRAFFSRGRMQKDVQRISGRGQQKNPQQRQQTPKKRNNQGLE